MLPKTCLTYCLTYLLPNLLVLLDPNPKEGLEDLGERQQDLGQQGPGPQGGPPEGDVGVPEG